MENKMDSLFKKKLESHSLTPREDAWARIESGLSKKNKFLSWRIAAALLVAGALITAVVVSIQKSEPTTLANQSGKTNAQPTTDSTDHSIETVKNTGTKKKTEATRSFASSQKKRQSIKTQTRTVQQVSEKSVPTELSDKENSFKRENISEQNLVTDATAVTQNTSTSIEKPIKLEFTLEEVEADQTAVAKTETKNSSLKKMLDAARQIKNGEGPVTQLLEKKDELFAFNFKKEKQKTQH